MFPIRTNMQSKPPPQAKQSTHTKRAKASSKKQSKLKGIKSSIKELALFYFLKILNKFITIKNIF